MALPDAGAPRRGAGRARRWLYAALAKTSGPMRATLHLQIARAVSASQGEGRRTRRLRRHARALPLLARFIVLCASAFAALRYPALWFVAAAVWVWVVWSLAVRPRSTEPRGGPPAAARPRRTGLRVRYMGGHPLLPRPGPGVVHSWPEDGAAELRVGRRTVAFPVAAVQAVTLVEGRVMLHTGSRGHLAAALGRLMAAGMGKYCGLRRHRHEDLAVIDRSRVLCDLQRQGRPCRVLLSGPRGGGEDVYLELLVMLRPLQSWPQPGAPGGPMGAASSPPQAG